MSPSKRNGEAQAYAARGFQIPLLPISPRKFPLLSPIFFCGQDSTSFIEKENLSCTFGIPLPLERISVRRPAVMNPGQHRPKAVEPQLPGEILLFFDDFGSWQGADATEAVGGNDSFQPWLIMSPDNFPGSGCIGGGGGSGWMVCWKVLTKQEEGLVARPSPRRGEMVPAKQALPSAACRNCPHGRRQEPFHRPRPDYPGIRSIKVWGYFPFREGPGRGGSGQSSP